MQRSLIRHTTEGEDADEVIVALDHFTSALNMLMIMIIDAYLSLRKAIRRYLALKRGSALILLRRPRSINGVISLAKRRRRVHLRAS